jgi:hypothetical protein
MRPEGALGSSQRTLVNVADCRGKIVFKVKKILALQLRNSESCYQIEWEHILVNTWEPGKHLESNDRRVAIQAWELQSAVCVNLALLITCNCFQFFYLLM